MRGFPGLCLGLWLCATTIACSRAMFVPPVGPGTPVSDAADAWREATSGCRDARTYAAALRASGRFGSERLWPVGIQTAVTADQSIYLSASAAGQSLFVLAGTGNQATLWLRREERAVTAAPADILNAIVGMHITPERLLAVLTGCVTRSFDIARASGHGGLLAIETADARLFLEAKDGRQRVKYAATDAFTVEFGFTDGPLPAEIWMWSVAGRDPAASIHFSVSDPEINGQIPATVFEVQRGAKEAKPLTLEELRAAGPWKDRSGAPGK